jgi:penicillin-binding protein 2
LRGGSARVAWFLAALGLSMSLLGVRLYQMSVLETAAWQAQAEAQTIRMLREGGPRGMIRDRNGRLLATSEPAYTAVLADPAARQIRDYLPSLALLLADGNQAQASALQAQIEKELTGRRLSGRQYEPLILQRKLSPRVATAFVERQQEFPGASLIVEPLRTYPGGETAGPVLGYVRQISQEELSSADFRDYQGTDLVGKAGLELTYEEELRGTPGHRQILVDTRGRPVGHDAEEPPVPGNTLVLTLDLDLQRAAEEALRKQIDWIRQLHDPHAKPGRAALVVQDVRSGAILAMVSTPGFEPNALVRGLSDQEWERILKTPGYFINWAVAGFAPGSAYKMMTGLAALENGVLGPSEQIHCAANYWKYGGPRNWNGEQGLTDVRRALTISCNPFFFEAGDRLGIDRLHTFAATMGFGSRTGIDLPGEQAGVNPSRQSYGDRWFPGQVVNVAIGQGDVLVTPLQLAGYAAAIATGGTRFRPHLVAEVRRPTGELLRRTEPELLAPVMASAQNWALIHEGMRRVVTDTEGTAHWAFYGFPIPVAAKTGSAETPGGYPHALTVAFAPYEHPEIAVSLFVEGGGSGSLVAPVVRRVMAHYFGIHEVMPEAVPTYPDSPTSDIHTTQNSTN